MGAKQIMETFGLLATFMNHDGAWITGREERGEDTQITTSCSGSRTLLSREKRHDYFKHSLPSGLWERKETLSSSYWTSLNCLVSHGNSQNTQNYPILCPFVTGIYPISRGRMSCQCLSSHFPSPKDREVTPACPGRLWPPVLSPAAPSHDNEIITMFVQCRPDQ